MTTSPTPRLIALCSPAMGSGKSTVAQHLEAKHGFIRVPFAAPLKAMAEGLLRGMSMSKKEACDRVYGDRKEEVIPLIGITSRRLQQLIGTEFGRNMIRESLWVDLAIGTATAILKAGHSVVIDDMRYINEHDAVLVAGGTCFRIVRPGTVVTEQHSSEGELDRLNMFNIVNDGTIKQLQRQIDSHPKLLRTVSTQS